MELAQGYRDLPSGNVGFYRDGILESVLDPVAEEAMARAELEAELRNERFFEDLGYADGADGIRR